VNIRVASIVAVACVSFLACNHADARPANKRALLVGINDYSVTRGMRPKVSTSARDWPNLKGAVNDVRAMEEMLVLVYGFDRRNIVTLTDHAATREAILGALERHLVKPAAEGDVVFFYFAGHGSQVPNSLSDEKDRHDESLVPADSRAGARDIRDKELRSFFNRILDRGARLTVMLDNCHSGSGARGLTTGAVARGIDPEPRDIADRTDYGARPENRGALILSATEDFDKAWETRDDEGKWHGTFSWAWMRAMRDASTNESAGDTFLRAHARMTAETPFQEPVLGGNESAQRAPFLGTRIDRDDDRIRVAVERVQSDGIVRLQGGWANGLAVGTELSLANDPQSSARLIVIAIHGLGESSARVHSGRAEGIRSGALLEVVSWVAPPGKALRVVIPRVAGDLGAVTALARSIHDAARQRNVLWVSDPIEDTPTHVLRRGVREWELLGGRGVERLASDADAVAAVTKLGAGSSLFVQLPASADIATGVGITQADGIELTDRTDDADYILVGRYSGRRVSYAWMRPGVKAADRRKTGLPLQTAWVIDDAPLELRDAILRLRKVHAWQRLESPPEARSPYRLGMLRDRNKEWAIESIVGDEKYDLFLRVASPVPARVPQRHVYVFVIDSHGKSVLLLPKHGSVENRFPLSTSSPPTEIALGETAAFFGAPPYGIDTYVLLTTDEPLANPWVLQWDGVRSGGTQPLGPLDEILQLTVDPNRGKPIVTPRNWSIERVMLESVPPRVPAKGPR
jgi:uncharacterized caspase-like protein